MDIHDLDQYILRRDKTSLVGSPCQGGSERLMIRQRQAWSWCSNTASINLAAC